MSALLTLALVRTSCARGTEGETGSDSGVGVGDGRRYRSLLSVGHLTQRDSARGVE